MRLIYLIYIFGLYTSHANSTEFYGNSYAEPNLFAQQYGEDCNSMMLGEFNRAVRDSLEQEKLKLAEVADHIRQTLGSRAAAVYMRTGSLKTYEFESDYELEALKQELRKYDKYYYTGNFANGKPQIPTAFHPILLTQKELRRWIYNALAESQRDKINIDKEFHGLAAALIRYAYKKWVDNRYQRFEVGYGFRLLLEQIQMLAPEDYEVQVQSFASDSAVYTRLEILLSQIID